MEKILVATRLEGPTYHRLKDLAGQRDRTVSYLVRKAVEHYVEGQGREEEKSTRSRQRQES